MYLFITRYGEIKDSVYNLNFIKRQEISGLIIGCPPEQATGIVGSDGDTQYKLASRNLDDDAILIKEIDDNLEYNINSYKWDMREDKLEFKKSLQEAKEEMQNKNKQLFAQWLDMNPLIWVDGKQYGITQEDQIEINLNISQYENNQKILEDGVITLEWHAKGETSRPWDINELRELSLAIQEKVKPMFHLMQLYKKQIFDSKDINELLAIDLNYSKEVVDNGNAG